MAILHFPIILPILDKSTLFQVHIRKSKEMSPKDDVTMETQCIMGNGLCDVM